MNSFQRFIPLDTPPLLILDISAFLFVLYMSIWTIASFSNPLARASSYRSLLYFYEDEDGVADAESIRHNPDRIPVALLASCLVLNALLALVRACVPHGPDHAIHTWLQFAMAVSLVFTPTT